jgi:hypothetical protein
MRGSEDHIWATEQEARAAREADPGQPPQRCASCFRETHGDFHDHGSILCDECFDAEFGTRAA